MTTRLLSALTFVLVSTSPALAKTNILLITADDLGLQRSCYGDPYIKTPHLDSLAVEGVKFRTAYVTGELQFLALIDVYGPLPSHNRPCRSRQRRIHFKPFSMGKEPSRLFENVRIPNRHSW